VHSGQKNKSAYPEMHCPLLFQGLGDVFRVLFVTLKYLQTGREKVLQSCIARIGNEHRLERIVDGLVIGDFIISVGFVKRRAA
jgi:hypothetical protein